MPTHTTVLLLPAIAELPQNRAVDVDLTMSWRDASRVLSIDFCVHAASPTAAHAAVLQSQALHELSAQQHGSKLVTADVCLQATSQQLHEALLRFSQLDGQVEALAAQRADSEARAGRWRERYRVSSVLAVPCEL